MTQPPPRPSSRAQTALDEMIDVEQQIADGDKGFTGSWTTQQIAAARAELSGLRERIKALETALERYGRHDDSFVPRARCAVHKIVNGKYAPCDCGFDAALKGPQ